MRTTNATGWIRRLTLAAGAVAVLGIGTATLPPVAAAAEIVGVPVYRPYYRPYYRPHYRPYWYRPHYRARGCGYGSRWVGAHRDRWGRWVAAGCRRW